MIRINGNCENCKEPISEEEDVYCHKCFGKLSDRIKILETMRDDLNQLIAQFNKGENNV